MLSNFLLLEVKLLIERKFYSSPSHGTLASNRNHHIWAPWSKYGGSKPYCASSPEFCLRDSAHLRGWVVQSSVLLIWRSSQDSWEGTRGWASLEYGSNRASLPPDNRWQLLDLHQSFSQQEVNRIKNEYFGLLCKTYKYSRVFALRHLAGPL